MTASSRNVQRRVISDAFPARHCAALSQLYHSAEQQPATRHHDRLTSTLLGKSLLPEVCPATHQMALKQTSNKPDRRECMALLCRGLCRRALAFLSVDRSAEAVHLEPDYPARSVGRRTERAFVLAPCPVISGAVQLCGRAGFFGLDCRQSVRACAGPSRRRAGEWQLSQVPPPCKGLPALEAVCAAPLPLLEAAPTVSCKQCSAGIHLDAWPAWPAQRG